MSFLGVGKLTEPLAVIKSAASPALAEGFPSRDQVACECSLPEDQIQGSKLQGSAPPPFICKPSLRPAIPWSLVH